MEWAQAAPPGASEVPVTVQRARPGNPGAPPIPCPAVCVPLNRPWRVQVPADRRPAELSHPCLISYLL
jgi:hypothetical protein